MDFDPHSLLVQGFILVMGVVGSYYVAEQKVVGFYFWIASNFALIATNVCFESWGSVALYIYFTAIAFYSIKKWRRIAMEKDSSANHARQRAIANAS